MIGLTITLIDPTEEQLRVRMGELSGCFVKGIHKDGRTRIEITQVRTHEI